MEISSGTKLIAVKSGIAFLTTKLIVGEEYKVLETGGGWDNDLVSITGPNLSPYLYILEQDVCKYFKVKG